MGAEKAELADIEGVVHETREASLLFSTTGERSDAVWLPLSLVEVQVSVATSRGTVTMPQWLAEDRRLV